MRYLIIIFVILLSSCNKQQDSACSSSKTIVGKWQAYEQFRSPGIGGSYYPLADNEQFTVEFKRDASFIYSSNFPAPFLYDTFVDSTANVTVTSSTTGKSASWIYTLESACVLSLNVFTCYEGCTYRLKRIE